MKKVALTVHRERYMKKEKIKYESKYQININVNGESESLDITQEENIPDRNAIKIEFYKDRWRTPEEMVELLRKIIVVIENCFIDAKER